MNEFFLSMNPLVQLEDNLPNLAGVDDPAVVRAIRNARGVVMPRGISEKRYRKIRAIAKDWFPDLDARFRYQGKAKQTLLFHCMKVRYPRTILYSRPYALLDSERRTLHMDYPFVLKGDVGGGGSRVFPVTCRSELIRGLDRLPADEPVLIQEWIEHGGMDLRIVVLGAKMVSYFRVGGGNFYNNTCRGGRIREKIFPELQRKGMIATASFCRRSGINYAGFDLMFPDKGAPVFVEVNFNFGRKGLGGTPGFRRLFQEAVHMWQRGIAYPRITAG